jgi:hypothetical protein
VRRLDPRPRAAAHEDRDHPRRGCRTDVVVNPVADVSHLRDRQTELGRRSFEEPRIGLLDAPQAGRADEVHLQPELAQGRLGCRRLVAGDADPITGGGEVSKAVGRIRVQVVGDHRIRDAGRCALANLLGEIEARPEDPEGFAMVAAPRDDRATDRQEGQPRDPEPVGPGGPQAALVDQCLPDIEDDGANGHPAVRNGPAS